MWRVSWECNMCISKAKNNIVHLCGDATLSMWVFISRSGNISWIFSSSLQKERRGCRQAAGGCHRCGFNPPKKTQSLGFHFFIWWQLQGCYLVGKLVNFYQRHQKFLHFSSVCKLWHWYCVRSNIWQHKEVQTSENCRDVISNSNF